MEWKKRPKAKNGKNGPPEMGIQWPKNGEKMGIWAYLGGGQTCNN